MGNVPAKEGRSRSNSYASGSSAGLQDSNSRPSRRYTTTSVFASPNELSKKSKQQEEKDKQREKHYTNLIVNFNENVDGGYLAPYGTYKSNLDYNTDIVKNLIINRKLAPFFTPLQDFDEDWTDEELIIILSQLPLHSIETAYTDEDIDDIDNHKIHKSTNYYKRQEQKAKLQSLIEKIKTLQKEEEAKFEEEKQKLKDPNNHEPVSLNIPSKSLLLALYKDAAECPICFLYYPKNLNLSRCCRQPICSECFVQIKRLDPHPPHDDSSNDPSNNELPHTIISESSNCPYCAMPDFGVTYDPPRNIHTGINSIKPGEYSNNPFRSIPENSEAIMSSSSEKLEENLHMKSGNNAGSFLSSPSPSSSPSPILDRVKPRRKSSIAADSSSVVTTDSIRPDWETKLISARNKLARKAATASAIHASNLILPDQATSSNETGSQARRRSSHDTHNNNRTHSSHSNNHSSSYSSNSHGGSNSQLHSVEERMIEQALRLSLLDEEERKRKAQLEQQKKAKS